MKGSMCDQKSQVEACEGSLRRAKSTKALFAPKSRVHGSAAERPGVNPWSSDFPSMDEKLLAEKQRAYAHSLAANMPVMRMLVALLNCNVSLMDQESFVFGFQSP